MTGAANDSDGSKGGIAGNKPILHTVCRIYNCEAAWQKGNGGLSHRH